jgi:hypothetical protein
MCQENLICVATTLKNCNVFPVDLMFVYLQIAARILLQDGRKVLQKASRRNN